MAHAKLAIESLKGFEMNVKGRMAPVSKWIGAVIQLFTAEIESLILERDQKITQLEMKLGNRNLALNSKKHHVLTQSKIDLMGRISEHLLAVNS